MERRRSSQGSIAPRPAPVTCHKAQVVARSGGIMVPYHRPKHARTSAAIKRGAHTTVLPPYQGVTIVYSMICAQLARTGAMAAMEQSHIATRQVHDGHCSNDARRNKVKLFLTLWEIQSHQKGEWSGGPKIWRPAVVCLDTFVF